MSSSMSTQGTIEKLPPEVRLMVLERIPDLPTLQGFIHASPGDHAIYIQNRTKVLFSVLRNDMGPEVLLDALYLQSVIHDVWFCECSRPDYGCENFKQHTEDFIRVYESDRINVSGIHHKLDLNCLLELARVHWIVHFMCARYCNFALSLHPMSRDYVPRYKRLSKTETNRIYRAMYRFELYYGLLHYMHHSNNFLERCHASQFSGMPSGGSLAWVFCRQFTAWEVEEIICIRDYIFQYYASILGEFIPLINRDSEGIQRLSDCIDACRALASTGLGATNEIMKLVVRKERYYEYDIADDFHRKIHNVEWNEGYGFHIDFAARKPQLSVAFFRRRGAVTYECPEASNRLVQYEGDHQGPSRGWTWATRCRYHAPADTIDRALHWKSNPLANWGYVLWDSHRLEKWGMLESDPEELVAQNARGYCAWNLEDHMVEMYHHRKTLESINLMELVHRTN